MNSIVVKIFLLAAAFFSLSISAVSQTKRQSEFTKFLSTLDAAQLELQNGKPEAFKSLWSRSDDITLSGGFGGTIEKGWEAIGSRLDWVGKQFSNGSNKIERLVAFSDGDLGYVVQLEHIRFTVPSNPSGSTKDYRVTMIFRREKKSGWRVVHRQADSQFTKLAP
ncbi:MAG TPA: nuclear transport factor 2 family protein [Pyrinomonadaceae bacterium]|nr:nuclear transport factor 2 family protein [Pyrinomonadaceae bacterium]